jgi:hypothetical protein
MMRDPRQIARFSGLVLIAAGSPTLADELWRQDHADCSANPSHCYGGLASQQARNPGGPGWMYEAVDNFDARPGWRITSLEFWGGQATLTPAPTDGFMIRVYADDHGQVGGLVSTQDVFSFQQDVFFTWIPTFPLQGFHYTLDLPAPITFATQGRYWLAIVAIQPYGGPENRQWFWGLSDTVNGPYCQQSSNPPGNYAPETFDLAFVLRGDAGCYPNCDHSPSVPFLNVNDFICFQAAYAAGIPYANCDHSTTPPVLNVNDFICFQALFAAGCSAP